MNTWPDTDYGAIARYTRMLPLGRATTRRIYRNELMSFQRFIMCNGDGTVTEDSVTQWVQDRFQNLVPIVAVDHARWVHHFLDHLVQQGYLKVNPIAATQGRYGVARLATIVRALANVDSHGALEMRRPLPRWGSGLGPLMGEHLALMRTMGYRYDSQEVRFSAFDRFLQTRPDLTGQPLRAQLDAWTGESPTLTRAWDGSQLGAELSRAVRLRDPTAESLPSDPRLQRAIRRTYRAPYIYSPAEVARIFQGDTASAPTRRYATTRLASGAPELWPPWCSTTWRPAGPLMRSLTSIRPSTATMWQPSSPTLQNRQANGRC